MFEQRILAIQAEAARARAIHCQAVNAGDKNHPVPSDGLLRPPAQVAAQKPLPGLILRSKGLDRIETMRRNQQGG